MGSPARTSGGLDRPGNGPENSSESCVGSDRLQEAARRSTTERTASPRDQLIEGQGRREGLCPRKERPTRFGYRHLGLVEHFPGPEMLSDGLDLEVRGDRTG